MINIYDSIVPEYATTFKRYNRTYTLEKRFRMGGQRFFSFEASGVEKLLVIPTFAEQFREVEKVFRKFGDCKKLSTCENHIKKEINRRIVVEEMMNDLSSTGFSTTITTIFRDIQITVEYFNENLILTRDFEIISNNLFGNGIVVTMDIDMNNLEDDYND